MCCIVVICVLYVVLLQHWYETYSTYTIPFCNTVTELLWNWYRTVFVLCPCCVCRCTMCYIGVSCVLYTKMIQNIFNICATHILPLYNTIVTQPTTHLHHHYKIKYVYVLALIQNNCVFVYVLCMCLSYYTRFDAIYTQYCVENKYITVTVLFFVLNVC